jgi:dienelactone hydrolase
MDKYEVTNKEYKKFIDAGGYKSLEFWKYPFIKDGQILAWEKAMTKFVDQTGHTGPLTWKLGTYPVGQDYFPVVGVSWYEAAAFARYLGKILPTSAHWRHASGINNDRFRGDIYRLSNFEGKGVARVGDYQSIGPYGTFDMAGNVKEWCFNAGDERDFLRINRGGGFNEPQYSFGTLATLPAFSRLSNLGFRCMQTMPESDFPDVLKNPIKPNPRFDHFKEKPVDKETFNILKNFYSYRKIELEPNIEYIEDSHPYWKKEKVSFNTYYGTERMSVYLFMPKNVSPPYQTVLYYPGDAVRRLDSLIHYPSYTYDFFIKGGRAVVFPVFQDMLDRRLKRGSQNKRTRGKELRIMWYKDIVTSLDYIENRSEFDMKKLAYYGFSQGAMWGVIFLSCENRFKVAVLQSGGLQNNKLEPESYPINFAPHVKIPVLMLNGRYDFFDVETQQKPLFQWIGSPDKDKRHIIYESGHAIWPLRKWMNDTNEWFNKYLGPVN